MGKGSTLVVASSETHSVVSVYDFNNTFKDLRLSVQTCHVSNIYSFLCPLSWISFKSSFPSMAMMASAKL